MSRFARRLSRVVVSPEVLGPTGPKPTEATVGPRITTFTTHAGGAVTGTYSGVRFTNSITVEGSLTLTDCVIDGSMQVIDGPVLMEYCTVNGWFGVTTDNTDPYKAVFTGRHIKTIGPADNDAIRISSYNWGDLSKYTNTVIEDSILTSVYDPAADPTAHFDLLQWGGGIGTSFNRVVLSSPVQPFHSSMTNYLNNGVGATGITLQNLWIEGGPVGYVLSGPFSIQGAIIQSNTVQYGYVYPGSGVTLTNVYDENWNKITA